MNKEEELNQVLYEMFKESIPVLENIKQGFLAQNQATLTEAESNFVKILTSQIPLTEELVKEKQKGDIEKKFLTLLPHLQLIAAVVQTLIKTKKKKLTSDVLFTDRAINGIIEIYSIMQAQFGDTKDFVLTKNPHLRRDIETGMEKIYKMADEYALEHEKRLIEGLCMPKASYLYLFIMDSIKRISRELTSFSETL